MEEEQGLRLIFSGVLSVGAPTDIFLSLKLPADRTSVGPSETSTFTSGGSIEF